MLKKQKKRAQTHHNNPESHVLLRSNKHDFVRAVLSVKDTEQSTQNSHDPKDKAAILQRLQERYCWLH